MHHRWHVDKLVKSPAFEAGTCGFEAYRANQVILMIMDMREHIRESNLIENIDDPAEDKRSRWAWNWFIQQPEITREVLLELHRRITLKQLPASVRGRYRPCQVWVGRHAPPGPALVPGMMYTFLLDLGGKWPSLDPIEMHVRFETIHPFIDGNGRTGRMLLWWHQIQRGEEPTLFKAAERWGLYYPLFSRDHVNI